MESDRIKTVVTVNRLIGFSRQDYRIDDNGISGFTPCNISRLLQQPPLLRARVRAGGFSGDFVRLINGQQNWTNLPFMEICSTNSRLGNSHLTSLSSTGLTSCEHLVFYTMGRLPFSPQNTCSNSLKYNYITIIISIYFNNAYNLYIINYIYLLYCLIDNDVAHEQCQIV